MTTQCSCHKKHCKHYLFSEWARQKNVKNFHCKQKAIALLHNYLKYACKLMLLQQMPTTNLKPCDFVILKKPPIRGINSAKLAPDHVKPCQKLFFPHLIIVRA